MAPPHDYRLPPDLWVRRLADGSLDISPALVDLLADSRSDYDWPKDTGAAKSQRVINELEREVETLLRGLDAQRGHSIVQKVSKWGGNNLNAQESIDKATLSEQVRMRDAICQVLNPSTLKRGLDEFSNLPGLRLVMATKIYRFCCPAKGAAVDQHASYFFNSLNIIETNGTRNKCVHFKREWGTARHTSSRLAIYSSAGHKSNCEEFVNAYLPLMAQIAESLNLLGVTYKCAETGENKKWRPSDVEMSVYYWGASKDSR